MLSLLYECVETWDLGTKKREKKKELKKKKEII